MPASIESLLRQAAHAEGAYLEELRRDTAVTVTMPGLLAAAEARVELFDALADERHARVAGARSGDPALVAQLVARNIAHQVWLAEEERGHQFHEDDARKVVERVVQALELPVETIEAALGEWKESGR